METKICPKCEIEKSIQDFKKHSERKDGLDYWCRECARLYNKAYYRENSHKAKAYAIENRDKIKDRMREYDIKYRERNAEMIKTKKKQYYESFYKVARRERMAKNARDRRKAGQICKLNKNMSLAIWRSLQGNKNGSCWEKLVGYTLQDLKQHLEKQFRPGMNWGNYGKTGWEIDHKIPISFFNIKGAKSKGFKKCWDIENLQPMWQRDNAIKSNKLFAA